MNTEKTIKVGYGLLFALVACGFVFLAAVACRRVYNSRFNEICFRFAPEDKEILDETKQISVYHANDKDPPAWANSMPLGVESDIGHFYRVLAPECSTRIWIRCDLKPGATVRRMLKMDKVVVNGKEAETSANADFEAKTPFAECAVANMGEYAVDGWQHKLDMKRHVMLPSLAAFAVCLLLYLGNIKGAGDRIAVWLSRNWEIALLALFVFFALIYKLDMPFRLGHDDNSALFSSFARSHLAMGLSKTFGQDFYTYRATGEMIPYLHHPPFVALWLALWFKITGLDTPAVVRSAMGLLQFCSFGLFSMLASKLLKSRIGRDVAIFTFAVVPMNIVLGKMANHQIPGLFFLLLGAFAAVCGYMRNCGGNGNFTVLNWSGLAIGWTGALLSSWHASIAALSFTVVFLSALEDFKEKKRFAVVAFCSLAAGAVAFLVPFAIVHGGHAYSENAAGIAAWMRADPGSKFVLGILKNWSMAITNGILDYGFLPWLMLIAFLMRWFWRFVSCQRIERVESIVLALACGNMVYGVLFSKALYNHLYQIFYFLPSLALVAGLAFARFEEKTAGKRTACFKYALLLVFVGVTGFVSLERLRFMYEKGSGYARKQVQIVIDKYI